MNIWLIIDYLRSFVNAQTLAKAYHSKLYYFEVNTNGEIPKA